MTNFNDVKFDKNSLISSCGSMAYGPYSVTGQRNGSNVEINSKFTKTIYMSGTNYTYGDEHGNPTTFVDDVKLVINNAESTPSIMLGSQNTGNGKGPKFNGDVIIDVKNATSVKFLADGSTPIIDGKLVVIANANTIEGKDVFDDVDADKEWIIFNETGVKGLISVTETDGVFQVNADPARFTVTAKLNGTGEPISPDDGKFTLDPGKYVIEAVKIIEEKTYYVNAGGTAIGTGDGSSADNAAASVATVVAKANEFGLIAGDTIYVKLVNTTTESRAVIHENGASVPAHTAKLIISSAVGGEMAYIYSTDENNAISLGGPTEFKSTDVKVNQYAAFMTNFNDVKFDSNSLISSCSFLTFGPRSVSGTRAGSTVEINSKFEKTIYMTSYNYTYGKDNSNPTVYKDDVKLVINNANSKPSIMLGSPNMSDSDIGPKFNKDVIIDIKNAASVKFLADVSKPVVEGKFVVIANAATVEGKDVFDDVTASKKWIIFNETGIKNLISATETEGEFKVNADSRFTVTAKMVGSDEKFNANDGILTLGEGKYEILVSKKAETKTYYVNAGGKALGTGDGSSPKNAAATINQAIAYANDYILITGDTIDVKIVGSSEENRAIFAVATERGTSGVGDLETMNSHTAKLVVSPYKTKMAYIHTDSSLNVGMNLGGETKFVSCDLKFNEWSYIIANGHKLTLDANSVLNGTSGITLRSGTVTAGTYPGQTIILDGKINTNINIPTHDFVHESNFTEDINIVINNEKSSPKIRFGSSRGEDGKQAVLEKNLNINIMSAATVEFKKVDKPIKIKGGLQLIIHSDTSVVGTDVVENVDAEKGTWFIRNASGIGDLLTYTETPGTFKVKDNKKVYVTNIPTGEVKEFTDGVVTIPEGIYSVSDSLVEKYQKMVYFNTSTGNAFASWATVSAGHTYRLEYFAYSTDYKYLAPTIVTNGNRNKIFENEDDVKLIEQKDFGNYKKFTYEFTLPEDLVLDENKDTATIFIGVNVSFFTEGYLWGFRCYDMADPYKNDCVYNIKFMEAFDYWIWGWDFWGKIKPSTEENKGVTNFNNRLILMDFDLSKVDQLIADLNRDDGEWWGEGDIIEDAAQVGTIKGTFVDQNGNPLSNIKLRLAAAEREFNTTTNAKGEFIFKDVPCDFYELFFVTEDGKLIETGFFAFIEIGDIVTIKLTSDLSAGANVGDDNSSNNDDYVDNNGGYVDNTIPEDSSDIDIDDTQTQAATGTLTGTVYTPQLKTVANIKIYLDTVGDTVTDANGSFVFNDVAPGEYELYTILEDGTKYVFRKVTIKENVELAVKLKYDVASVNANANGTNVWIWIIVACGAVLLIAAGVVTFIIIKKKKAQE